MIFFFLLLDFVSIVAKQLNLSKNTDRDEISVINNRETEGNVPSVVIYNG